MENTELKSVIETLNGKIDSFRSEVESVKGADVVTETKLAKMEADLADTMSQKAALEVRLSAMEAAANRPGAVKGVEVDEHKEAFVNFIRKSDDYAVKNALQAVETKSVSIGVPANGGVAVPSVTAREIARVAGEYSPFRSLARVVSVSNENYTELLNNGAAGSGWTNETGTRTDTVTPTLSAVKPTFGEVYAIAEVSNHALNDVMFDVEAWLISEIAQKFASAEAAAFIAGDGVSKPTGLLNGTTVSTVGTGVAANFGANPFDNIMDLRYGVKAEYAAKGVFLMNSATQAALAKVKDTTGNYIYQPSVVAGVADSLLGKKLFIEENMPSVAANAKAVAFGDMSRAYVIADLVGMSIIIDNVTKKGWTSFYVSKRLGGNVKDAAAVKLLQVRV